MKALLAFREQTILRTHDLSDLERACSTLEPGLDLSAVNLTALTPYAVELRYDFDFGPEREEAVAALEAAREVREAVLAVVPPEARP